jgi:hypothetical protein
VSRNISLQERLNACHPTEHLYWRWWATTANVGRGTVTISTERPNSSQVRTTFDCEIAGLLAPKVAAWRDNTRALWGSGAYLIPRDGYADRQVEASARAILRDEVRTLVALLFSSGNVGADVRIREATGAVFRFRNHGTRREPSPLVIERDQ